MEEFSKMKIINNPNDEKEKIEDLEANKYEDQDDGKKFKDSSSKELLTNSSISKQDNKILKDSNYHQKRFNLLRKDFYIFLGFFLIYSYYLLSLERCFKGEDVCSTEFDWIFKKITEEIYSCILTVIMIELMVFKKISKIHVIHFVFIFLFFFLISHGVVFDDHGYYNFLYYFILLSLIILLLIPLNCLLRLKKGKNIFKIIFIYFLTVFIIFYFFYLLLIHVGANCNDWTQGLNNTSIDNDLTKYGCIINVPKICAYKLLEPIQDYAKIQGKNCSIINNGKELKKTFLEKLNSPYANDKITRFGYPLMNKYQECFISYQDYDGELKKYFLKNVIDMDNEKILNEYIKENKPEAEVDFSDIDNPKLKINVNFNKTLSEERKKLEKNSNPYSNNMLIIFIDSVTRVNGLRQLKKTTKFFEKFMSYKGYSHEKYPNDNFHSFQFFKYYSFFGFTGVNYPFLFYGTDSGNINKYLITKYYKENGFVTSSANDWCNIENTRTYHNFTHKDIYDHMFLLCDPNTEYVSIYTIRCLYGKHTIEHLLEYTDQFWRKYSNNRKYSIIFDTHGHEGTNMVIKYIDDMLSDFLIKLFNDNLLKDTTVLLLADHGNGMPSIYYTIDFYKIELNLPIMLILINDRKDKTYEEQYKYIHENQQTFITAFDIYNTLGNIIYGDDYNTIQNLSEKTHTGKSQYGISLFDKINPKERYPDKYDGLGKSGISKSSCIK